MSAPRLVILGRCRKPPCSRRHAVVTFPPGATHQGVQCQAGPSDVFVLDEGALINNSEEAFPGVAATLLYCDHPFYICARDPAKLSQKATQALQLKGFGDRTSPRILEQDGSADHKLTMLRQTMGRPMCLDPGVHLHYVDSNLDVLQAAAGDPQLQSWSLYYATWVEPSLRDSASSEAIAMLELHDFHELLKWGVVMGVDDGCEPQPEEIQAMILQDNQSDS